ncbi:MAG: flagellar hook-associated protein FlgK [Defluviitaleaceae bacterium]|nr:flagellar hook-associated protein FlgK [Defluviitaleaceae bacterium]
MRGSFFTFRVSQSGMHTARANLAVVAHNQANAGIHGFSRQVTVQSANPAINLRNGRGMFGTGSAVHNVKQIRDQFIDRRFWNQSGVYGQFAVKNTQLSLLEAIFNDLNDSNVLGGFKDFFSRLQSLSESSHEPTFRLNVIRAGESLSELVRSNAQQLHNQQRDVNSEIRAVVTEINSLGNQISILNQQIHQFELFGSNANDLRDQRALLIDRLSEFVNVEVQERDFSHASGLENDRRLTISINGYDFVNHFSHHALEVVARTPDQRRNESDVDGLYDIRFTSGAPFNIYSRNLRGTLRGLIDIRDGNGTQPTKVRVELFPVPAPGANPAPSAEVIQWLTNNPHLLPTTAALGDPTTWPRFINAQPWEISFNPATFDPEANPPQQLWQIGDAVPVGFPGIRAVETSVYKGIPFYMNRLNNLVRVFANAMNDGVDAQGNQIPGMHPGGHRAGFGLQGQTGNDFFNWADRDGNTVGGFLGNTHLLNALNFTINSELVRYPELMGASSSPLAGESNNDIILGFIRVGDYPSLFREGNLLDFIIATAGHLGISAQQAIRFRGNYNEMLAATQNQRASISDVCVNEELMNMTRFTQLFQNNARMIATMNEVYDTLINRLGVG